MGTFWNNQLHLSSASSVQPQDCRLIIILYLCAFWCFDFLIWSFFSLKNIPFTVLDSIPNLRFSHFQASLNIQWIGSKTMALHLLGGMYTDSDEDEDAEQQQHGSTNGDGLSHGSSTDSPHTLLNSESLTISSLIIIAGDSPAALSSEAKRRVGFPQCIDVSPVEEVKIPPETLRPASPYLESKISGLIKKQQDGGRNINKSIHDHKDFRNPSIYQKLIEMCGLDELGTNFERDDFDPARWGPESSLEELGKAQTAAMDRFQREKRPASMKNDASKRKTKWDATSSELVAPIVKAAPNLLALKMSGQAHGNISRNSSSGNLAKATKWAMFFYCLPPAWICINKFGRLIDWLIEASSSLCFNWSFDWLIDWLISGSS